MGCVPIYLLFAFARTFNAEEGGGVEFKPLGVYIFFTAETIAEFIFVDPLKRGLYAFHFDLPATI